MKIIFKFFIIATFIFSLANQEIIRVEKTNPNQVEKIFKEFSNNLRTVVFEIIGLDESIISQLTKKEKDGKFTYQHATKIIIDLISKDELVFFQNFLKHDDIPKLNANFTFNNSSRRENYHINSKNKRKGPFSNSHSDSDYDSHSPYLYPSPPKSRNTGYYYSPKSSKSNDSFHSDW